MPNRSLDKSIIDEIQAHLNAGMMQKEICDVMGITSQRMSGIIKRYGLKKKGLEVKLPSFLKESIPEKK